MALAKTSVQVLAATSNATYSSTKTSPGITSGTIDCTSYYDGDLSWKITNGTAPNTALIMTVQVSPDAGTTWYDYYTTAGDVTASSQFSGTIKIDRAVKTLRVIAYAYSVNPVTVQADLTATTSL